MTTELPQTLIDILDSIDRNARAYGWEVAKRDAYPPDGSELSPENPFIHANWRDRIAMQRAVENFDPDSFRVIVGPEPEITGADRHVEVETLRSFEFDLVEELDGVSTIQPLKASVDVTNEFTPKVEFVLDSMQKGSFRNPLMTTNEVRNKFSLQPRYTLSSGVEIECNHKLLPPELYRINIEVEQGTRSSSFQTHRYPELTIWRVTFIPDNVKKLPDNRDPECVKRWSNCESGGYHPDCCRFPKSCSCDIVRGEKEIKFTGFTTETDIPTGDQRDLVSRGLPDIVKKALDANFVTSCHDCPFGHHVDPREEWENDPSEAYFSCDLGFGDNPERFWGEYPPCDKVFINDGYAQRVLQSMGLLEFMTSKE